MKLRWRFGIVAGLFLAAFALYPQMKMIYLRGAEWNGHYAYNDIDEVAYAAYVKALIDGRPRKNDPYTGRDDSPETPQPESLFSIQFAAPYTVALPARILGINAPWAMTISGAIAALLTALAIFWLVARLTDDDRFAMAGSLVVLAGGAIFAGEGAIGEILETSYAYPYFPGFRRYIPALAMPAFFAFVALVWKAIAAADGAPTHEADDPKQQRTTSRWLWISLACLAFAYTAFSYFYIWTTAIAWLGCLTLCWLAARPEGWLNGIKRLAFVASGCGVSLIVYAYLLSNRAHTLDEVQLLVQTRELDLTRPPELVGFVVLGLLGIGVLLGRFAVRDRAVLFTVSLAMTTIVVFNQQVLTGRELQPIHYQVFIGNYVAGLSAVLTAGLFWRTASAGNKLRTIAATALALLAAGWGFVECHYTVRILDDVNVARDEAYPVAQRLAQLARGSTDPHRDTVLHMAIAEADDLPTVAPQAVLWARHQHIFAGVTTQENKERYYQLLHYSGVSPDQLASAIKSGDDIVSVIALFGWGRHTDRLNSQYSPIRFAEVDEEARKYAQFLEGFDARDPRFPRLKYLVVGLSTESHLANLDRWYERTDREVIGPYVLYRLQVRQ